MSTPTAVLFDLYGTLLLSAPETGRLGDALLARGLQPGPDSYDWLLNGLAQARLAEALGVSFEKARDLPLTRPLGSVRDLARALLPPGAPEPSPDVLRETEELFQLMEGLCSLKEGAEALLQAAREAGLRLALITNATSLGLGPVATTGLKRWMHASIVSCEVGLTKPDPRIFHAALSALEVEPAQAVMVGDSWTSDIVGALRVGLRALWLDTGLDPLANMLLPEGREQLLGMMERQEDGRLAFEPGWRSMLERYLPVPLEEVERELSAARDGQAAPLTCLRGVTRVTSLAEATEVLLPGRRP